MSQYEVTFAGFGGQGVMVAGQILAYTGIKEGKNVVWLPSYGPEMRGGTAYCTVVISDARIGSPIINSPLAVCVFNRPSLDKFGPKIKPGGLLLINSSLIDAVSGRTDITEVLVPGNDIALKGGSVKALNMAMLGAFVGASGVVGYETLRAVVLEKMGRKKELLEINYKVIEEGFNLGRVGQKQGAAK